MDQVEDTLINKKEWNEVEITFEEGTMIGDTELISAKGTGVEIGKFLRGIHFFQNIQNGHKNEI